MPIIGLIPESISTDCDQTFRNAISVIFPESATLLCVWHANKKTQQHCKARFTTSEDYNDFFKAWQEIGQSLDIPDYNSGLLLFLSEY